jgi:ATP-dependent helicase YprA (DUF1998 family)
LTRLAGRDHSDGRKNFSIEAVCCQVNFFFKYAAKNAISLPLPVQNMASSYCSEAGYALISDILARNPTKPVQPHNFQVEGIGHALDGDDLLVTMATGSGKTGFYCFLMLVIVAISEDPSLAIAGRVFPKNPCMILISPTKALQEDMVCKLSRAIDKPSTNFDKAKEHVCIWC